MKAKCPLYGQIAILAKSPEKVGGTEWYMVDIGCLECVWSVFGVCLGQNTIISRIISRVWTPVSQQNSLNEGKIPLIRANHDFG